MTEEAPTPQHPHRVPDPGYDPGLQSAPSPSADLPPDNLVERTVERAAEKVAAVTVPGGPPVMSRTEGFICVAVLVILNLAAFFVSLSAWKETQSHRADFRAVCQLLVDRAPGPESALQLARALAECLE